MLTISEILTTMEYGPALEGQNEVQAWLERHQRRFGLFIDNAWSAPGEPFAAHDLVDGAQLADLTQATSLDVERAVQAARHAQPLWQALGGHGRARILYALARLLQKHARLCAVLATLDSGQTIHVTRDIEMPLAVRHFYHCAGWAQLQAEEFPDYRASGVVGQIASSNVPLRMLAWKIAPALAAGNSVVFKPSKSSSLSALLFAELCLQAGVPAGVVNIVTGDGRVGAAMVRHAGIDQLSFTGSAEVARLIRAASAGSGKKLVLRLSGALSCIVFDDADLDAAVEGWIEGFIDSIRTCGAGPRLLVQESIQQRFLEKIRTRMETLRFGAPLDKSSDSGVLLAEQGKAAALALSFRTVPEAIALANNSVDRRAACVWTESISRALAVATELKVGMVWINSVNLFDAACGVGGREGMLAYMMPMAEDARPAAPPPTPIQAKVAPQAALAIDPFAIDDRIDHTAKLYIGGKQVRPDGGYSHPLFGAHGAFLADVATGNHKDIGNAVAAAHQAAGWAKTTAHNRAQVLYYIAENLALRATEFAVRIAAMTGDVHPEREVQAALERLFYCAAWADKYDGLVRQPSVPDLALAVNEPLGVIGIVCPNQAPLLGLIALVAPAIALGNRVVVLPSAAHPLSALDLYQVFDTSDLPDGVVNIVTGSADGLARTLACHSDIDAVWRHDGSVEGCAEVERLSAASLKRTWVGGARGRDWYSTAQSGGRAVLAHASRVKHIWMPYDI